MLKKVKTHKKVIDETIQAFQADTPEIFQLILRQLFRTVTCSGSADTFLKGAVQFSDTYASTHIHTY